MQISVNYAEGDMFKIILYFFFVIFSTLHHVLDNFYILYSIYGSICIIIFIDILFLHQHLDHNTLEK